MKKQIIKKKSVLITGIAGGIGSATATLFKKNGWYVIGTDIKKEDSKKTITDEFYNIDLSKYSDIKKLCHLISNKHNVLHVIVNNAAIQISKKITDLNIKDLNITFAINIRPIFLLAKFLYPLLKNNNGSIVNISSVHAVATSKKISAYATSKGAILALTRAMALDFAEDNIRVNAVLPGAVKTDMLYQGLDRGHLGGKNLKEKLDVLSRSHPLFRIGEPEEIAQMIYFLSDKNKSSFITGQGFIVDGGVMAKLSTE